MRLLSLFSVLLILGLAACAPSQTWEEPPAQQTYGPLPEMQVVPLLGGPTKALAQSLAQSSEKAQRLLLISSYADLAAGEFTSNPLLSPDMDLPLSYVFLADPKHAPFQPLLARSIQAELSLSQAQAQRAYVHFADSWPSDVPLTQGVALMILTPEQQIEQHMTLSGPELAERQVRRAREMLE